MRGWVRKLGSSEEVREEVREGVCWWARKWTGECGGVIEAVRKGVTEEVRKGGMLGNAWRSWMGARAGGQRKGAGQGMCEGVSEDVNDKMHKEVHGGGEISEISSRI